MSVLGMVEFQGIAVGILGSDAMVKAAQVELMESHPIDPGRYLAAVAGDVASVEASVRAGVNIAKESLVYSFVLPNLHPQILPALRGQAPEPAPNAVGIIETQTAAAIVEAADAACKAAPVQLMKLRLALHIGGKGYTTFVGDVADVEAAVWAGVRAAGDKLIDNVVIPNPYPEIFSHLVGNDDTCTRDR
ncbi:MAG: BMC domain-containing protein [Candidatus Hydrogenedentes bacterium]|nr:BMC domain-containing protein [Candidatus Hydrogenedentota bacterium]